MLERERSRALEAEHAGIIGLAVRRVRAGALAQHFGIAGDIEDVVLDLEREANFAAVQA